MNVAPIHNRSFPIVLVSQREGGHVELCEHRGDFLLVVESTRGARATALLTTEQAAQLATFKDPAGVARSCQEVERKWRPVKPEHLEAIGALESTAIKVSEIQQGYLCLGLDEARVRRKGDAYLLTLKSAGGLTRREVEISLSPAQFETLWPLTEGQRLEKMRSVAELPQPNGVPARIEIDRFRGCHAPLVLIECEFSSVDDAQGFNAPAYFGEEVTADPQFKNRSLVIRGHSATSLADVDLPHGR